MSIKDAKILIVEDEIQLNRVMELMLNIALKYRQNLNHPKEHK